MTLLQQAIEKLRHDLAWRTPSGQPQRYAVIPRELALALEAGILHYFPAKAISEPIELPHFKTRSQPNMSDNQIVTIDYTNHKGERRPRKVKPMEFFFTNGTQYHPEPGYFLSVVDQETGETRLFAMSGVHGWGPG